MPAGSPRHQSTLCLKGRQAGIHQYLASNWRHFRGTFVREACNRGYNHSLLSDLIVESWGFRRFANFIPLGCDQGISAAWSASRVCSGRAHNVGVVFEVST